MTETVKKYPWHPGDQFQVWHDGQRIEGTVYSSKARSENGYYVGCEFSVPLLLDLDDALRVVHSRNGIVLNQIDATMSDLGYRKRDYIRGITIQFPDTNT